MLVGEAWAKTLPRWASSSPKRRISVWYSAPTILALLAEHGRLDRARLSHAPRLVLFAGEVFPIAALQAASRRSGPMPRCGTSTGRPRPTCAPLIRFPRRFRPIAPFRSRSARSARRLARGWSTSTAATCRRAALGELVIAGPGVMRGYFGQPELTAAAFFADGETRWYRTGDLVCDDGAGCFQFHGRRDRMVKKRGYRIELGEIESALYRHDGVDRAGVVAQADDVGVSIAAFVALKPDQKKSIIAMKRHCMSYLPAYMIPDTFTFLDDLPRTSTDKVDYQRLRSLAALEGLRP